jgi:hypothetical protein
MSKKNRTDAEKVFANWTKTLGLYERKEYSVAIVRAAVTVELAANIIIRAELIQKRNLPAAFVDKLMLWANGLSGKFRQLIYPILEGTPNHQAIARLEADWKKVNKERNSVAHCGEFKNKKEGEEVVTKARHVLEAMLRDYEPTLIFGSTQSVHKKGKVKKS